MAVVADEVVAREGRDVGVGVELCLLNCGDADPMGVEEVAKFVEFSEDTVAVPLQQDREWRRKRT